MFNFNTELLHPSLERMLARCYCRYLDPCLCPSPLWHRISHPNMVLFPHLLYFYKPSTAQNWHSSGAIQRGGACACLNPLLCCFFHWGEVQVAASQLQGNKYKYNVNGEGQRWKNINAKKEQDARLMPQVLL